MKLLMNFCVHNEFKKKVKAGKLANSLKDFIENQAMKKKNGVKDWLKYCLNVDYAKNKNRNY